VADFDLKRFRVAVVMLTLNQREKTLKCLGNLLSLEEPDFDVLIWDNGSDDNTVEAVRAAYPSVHAHYHPENLGIAAGRNAAGRLAVEVFAPTHMLFLDNDMELEPDFVLELLKPFAKSEKVGQTQAKLLFYYDRERINDGGGNNINWVFGTTRPFGLNEIDRGQYDTPKKCVAGGGAMIVRTDIFQELGGFDEVYGFLGPDDLDFSLRISKAGYDVLYVPTAVAYHEVTHTYSPDYNEVYARSKATSWFIFLRRHAPLHKRLGFYFIGIPYLAVSVFVRQVRRGNFGAVRGLTRGMFDYLKSRPKSHES
jgi:GT2 family glycosyltransferase